MMMPLRPQFPPKKIGGGQGAKALCRGGDQRRGQGKSEESE